jgi:hypothetical protein
MKKKIYRWLLNPIINRLQQYNAACRDYHAKVTHIQDKEYWLGRITSFDIAIKTIEEYCNGKY